MADLTLGRDINVAVNRRMMVDAGRVDMFGSAAFIGGRFLVGDIGEVTVQVAFPMTYTEEPLFFFGGAMDFNQGITPGYFPTLSCVVGSWITTPRGPNGLYYTGANIVVVTTGTADQRMWVHWHVLGSALTNPVSSSASGTTDEAI